MGELSAGRHRDRNWATPKTGEVNGRFETDGAGAPINVKGRGFTVTKPAGTGQYLVTLDQAIGEYLELRCSLLDATSGTTNARILSSSLDPGDLRTKASFIIETHSVDGTEADLNGPIVTFGVVYGQAVT